MYLPLSRCLRRSHAYLMRLRASPAHVCTLYHCSRSALGRLTAHAQLSGRKCNRTALMLARWRAVPTAALIMLGPRVQCFSPRCLLIFRGACRTGGCLEEVHANVY